MIALNRMGHCIIAAAQGAELAFTYQGDALRKRVEPLAASVNSDMVMECDVTIDDSSVDAVFDELEAKWGKIDFVLHAIGIFGQRRIEGQICGYEPLKL